MVDSTRIIWDARFLSNSIFFSFAEFQFILRFPDLSDEEKLLWLFIAMHCAHDPDLLCALSLEEMATSLGKSQETIFHSLLKLQDRGFVGVIAGKSEVAEKSAYVLSLPSSGLLELKMAITEEISSRHLFLSCFAKAKQDKREDTEKLVRHRPRIMINLLDR